MNEVYCTFNCFSALANTCTLSVYPLYNNSQNKEKWNLVKVGQILVMLVHRLVLMEMAAYLTLWSGAHDVVVCGGSNMWMSRLIPIKLWVFCFQSLFVLCCCRTVWLLKTPISELLSHQCSSSSSSDGCCREMWCKRWEKLLWVEL